MTRIDLVSRRSANPFVRFARAASRKQLGRDVDPVDVYALAPGLLIGYGAFERATAKQHRVEERLKVLAETKAAAIVNCEFCCDIASSIARDVGVGESQLLALARYRDSGEFSELECLVLDYATAMSRTPTTVTDRAVRGAARALRRTPARRADERDRAGEHARTLQQRVRDDAAGFSEGMVCVTPSRSTAIRPAERARRRHAGRPRHDGCRRASAGVAA